MARRIFRGIFIFSLCFIGDARKKSLMSAVINCAPLKASEIVELNNILASSMLVAGAVGLLS